MEKIKTMEIHRKHCNAVKGMLIETIVELFRDKNETVSLLDLCSGRGGDMFKWNKSRIQRVIGIDNHQESVIEAINRYKKVNRKHFKTKISYYVDDAGTCDLGKYLKGKMVEIVTCQFALHYFQDLNLFFSRIVSVLKIGGYFIGVCPDGDIIRQLLVEQRTVEGVEIKPVDQRSYDFRLIEEAPVTENKAENYFSFRESEFSREYFVHKGLLQSMAKMYGLRLCSFCNLQTHFKGESPISGLYFSFVFQRMV